MLTMGMARLRRKPGRRPLTRFMKVGSHISSPPWTKKRWRCHGSLVRWGMGRSCKQRWWHHLPHPLRPGYRSLAEHKSTNALETSWNYHGQRTKVGMSSKFHVHSLPCLRLCQVRALKRAFENRMETHGNVAWSQTSCEVLQLVCPRSLLMAVEDGSDSFVDLIPCQYTAVIQSHPGTTMAQYLFQYSFLSQITFDPACILCLCVFF